MKYTVKIAKSAESDILTSLEWGIRNWGVAEARRWAVQIRKDLKTICLDFRLPVRSHQTVILKNQMYGT